MKKIYFDSYIKMFNNTFDFRSKTNLKDFWFAVLYEIAIGTILSFFVSILFIKDINVFLKVMYATYGLYEIVLFLPMLSMICRRLNDAGKTSWSLLWLLVPFVGEIVLIVFLASPSNKAVSLFPFSNFFKGTANQTNDGIEQENLFNQNQNIENDNDTPKTQNEQPTNINDAQTDKEQNEQGLNSAENLSNNKNLSDDEKFDIDMDDYLPNDEDYDDFDDFEDEKYDEFTMQNNNQNQHIISRSEQLAKLQQMKENSEISDEEYEIKVREILK